MVLVDGSPHCEVVRADPQLVTEALCYGSCDEGWVQLAHGLHDSLGQRVGLMQRLVSPCLVEVEVECTIQIDCVPHVRLLGPRPPQCFVTEMPAEACLECHLGLAGRSEEIPFVKQISEHHVVVEVQELLGKARDAVDIALDGR